LGRLQQICALENVSYDLTGLESIIFTAEGDMRNALNALQSTVSGFGNVTSENVFKVCDQPHPQKLRAAIERAREGKTAESMEIVMTLWGSGYAATDIIQTLFRVSQVKLRRGCCTSFCCSAALYCAVLNCFSLYCVLLYSIVMRNALLSCVLIRPHQSILIANLHTTLPGTPTALQSCCP
jgi:Replication factor C C-terminal domain